MTKQIFSKDNIMLGASPKTKEEAIRLAGKILVDNGYVDASYVEKMLEREEITSTYIGNYVAIPHGTEEGKQAIHETGLSFITVPDGVDFNGNTVKILIGIAGKGDDHLELLSKIAIVCSEEDNIQKMVNATSKDEILQMFEEVN
jgi:mannitol PTS system EIIA component